MATEHVFKVFKVKMSEKMARKMEEEIESGYYVSYADEIRQALSLLLDNPDD